MAHETTQPNANFYPEAMERPIPLMDELRRIKSGYGDVPIDTSHERFNEPLVALADYGIAGQAYYSRPNAATGEPVPGVDPNQYLRRSVAETLAELNRLLQQPAVAEFFGGKVQFYVQDALRPVSLQRYLYEEVFPQLIRKQNPGISDDAMAERRQHLIAKPSEDPESPSPHATGGVFDGELRYTEDGPEHKVGDLVELGHVEGDTGERVHPDYFETHAPQTPQEELAQRNRRAFFAIMTGAAFGIETELQNNPTEWWHWGRGDQLSARVAGLPYAIYSFAESPQVA